ncbi:class I SAM-dependent methyltransferase [Prosthecochloris sp. N3]|uniref:Class I SAM-dependent methyltransferase n=1 Tax=Prosthecochloris ethylica TaxID=2743976 RepID=A0ABR9XQ05_9CHLB|nr:class I SAM-dependent methyltransferase [Prosthecochloris ethylica]MBF0586212.1 class I SAM-dependent methyltransferase [Prosthecochloris ethylica]MBF0635918.1 class I SAM-dependent methyltransferase [Prosthecochloris ethylica]NUK47407.1 class I SAM-dependent methyltransferase [Prosthecochloris ethylica]
MTSSNRQHSSGWFADWFNHPLYLRLYSHRDETEAKRCVDTILGIVRPPLDHPSSYRIMDIACGAGRHALEFARKGFSVTANDLSPYLLQCARVQAGEEHLPLTCTQQDMRAVSDENAFDLVVQLFSSFGYFDSPDDDRLVVRNVFRALAKGGWYVLDLINPAPLKKNLRPHSRKTIDNLSVDEHRRIHGDRVIKDITITSPEETLEFSESVRLFPPQGIAALLEEEGFRNISMIGDYAGSPFNPETSPRMLVFCSRPS